MHRFATVLLFTLTLGSLAASGQYASVPSSYNAPTDRQVRSLPPLPALGPAGSIFTDPTFGNRILRVTDAGSLSGYPNVWFSTTAASYRQAWSADSTRFLIEAEPGDNMVYELGAGLSARYVGSVPIWAPCWSGTNRDTLIGISNRAIAAYNLSTRQTTTILSLDSVVPNYPEYEYAASASADDTKLVTAFGGIQDSHIYVVWYDANTGTRHLLNIQNSTIDGNSAPYIFRAGAGIHDVEVDRSGRFVRFSGPSVGLTDAGVIWDVQNNAITPITAMWSGHTAMGYGTLLNNSGVETPETSDGRGFTLRNLTTPNTNLLQLITPIPPPPYNWDVQGHESWANVQIDNNQPVLHDNAYESGTAWELWSGEIQAVATDGSGTVWRFAHNRSIHDGQFWDYPRGNVSPNGRYFIFTSNWEKTLGTSPLSGENRRDVFLLELPVGTTSTAPAPAPAPAIASPSPAPATASPAPAPAPSATSFQAIRVNAGGPAFVDSAGQTWSADYGGVGGTIYRTSQGIAEPYTGERYGQFAYAFSVPAGAYSVRLRFAEIWWTQAGQRLFNVSINGAPVLTNFDIVAAAGGPLIPIDKTFPVNASSGQIVIRFDSILDNAKISAIEILPATSAMSPNTSAAPVPAAAPAPAPAPALQPLSSGFQPIRVNVGGAAFVDSSGAAWLGDTGGSGGAVFHTDQSIPEPYASERYGQFAYAFTVPPGFYTVRLRFAELWWTQPGQRVFNVTINGTLVLPNFDIVQAAGAPFVLFDQVIPTTTASGQIVIRFDPVVDNAKVDGIEILPAQ